MALISLLLAIAWTLVVIRLCAIGAVLSERTVLSYFVLGALMAVSASPLAEKFIIPYPLADYGFAYLGALGRVLVRNVTLLAPVLTYLWMRRNHRLVSVADAFGLAFAIGLGFETTGAVLAASTARESLRGLTLLPPWQMTWDTNQRFPILGLSGDFAVAGPAYSVGFAALVFAAGLRFWRRSRKALTVTAVVLLLVTAHEALWVQQILTAGARLPSDTLAWLFDVSFYHGKLLAPVALAALLYLTQKERRWSAAALAEEPPKPMRLFEECQAWLRNIFTRGAGGWLVSTESERRRRQLAMVRAERALDPGDHQLFQSARLLELALERIHAPDRADKDELEEIAPSDIERRIALAGWMALFLVVIVMPWLPSKYSSWLWTFPLLNISLAVMPLTVLHVALAAVVLWRFIHNQSEPLAHWDGEEVFRFFGDNAISFAAMGAALLVLFQVPLNSFYPPYSTLAFFNRAPLPSFDLFQIAALILILGLCAGSLGLGAAARWRRQASAEEQRTAIVRRSIILANTVIFLWISVKIYIPLLASLQKALGPTAFTIFGKSGNIVVAFLTIVFFFAVSLALGYGLRQVSRRVESFLLRQPEPAPAESGSR